MLHNSVAVWHRMLMDNIWHDHIMVWHGNSMVWWCGMAWYGMVMAALGDNPALIGRYLSTFRPGDILFQRHHFLPTMFYIIARHLSANIIFERHYFLSAT